MISRYRRLFVALVSIAVAATAWGQNNGNAVTIISDTAEGGGPGGGNFFVVTAVDGKDVTANAISESLRASAGRGAYMTVVRAERPVPHGRVTLLIKGTHEDAAPIQSIFRAVFKGIPEVAGSINVELAQGQRYRVNGVLDHFKREVWLEDEKGVEVPGSKVAAPPDPELVKQMEGAVYAATNLRYESDWISEVPWVNWGFVPVGSRIKVMDYGSNRVSVLVNGRKMRMGIDLSRGKETIQQFCRSGDGQRRS